MKENKKGGRTIEERKCAYKEKRKREYECLAHTPKNLTYEN